MSSPFSYPLRATVLTLLLTVILGGILVPQAIHAQGAFGLKIDQAVIRPDGPVTPGTVFQKSFSAKNTGTADRMFYIITRDVRSLTDSSQPVFAEPGEMTNYGIASWLTIPAEPIVIRAGETASIPFTVTVPQDAAPGGHYGAIFLSLKPGDVPDIGSAIAYQVGTLLEFRIAGTAVEEARVREFASKQDVYGSPVIPFTVKVENLGNVLARPRGLVEIFNMFGKKVGDARVNDTEAAVFPGGTRTFETVWTGDTFTFGRYQAVLGLVYGDESRKTLSATRSFLVIPLKIVLPALGIMLALGLGTYLGAKFYVRRKLRALYPTGGAPTVAARNVARETAPISRLAAIVLSLALFAVVFIIVLIAVLA